MKHRLTGVFNWWSKHYRFVVAIVSFIGALYFVFVKPLLLTWVYLPVWALLVLIVLPFVLVKLYRFYFVKSCYKKGDKVCIKGNSKPYFVIGYSFLNKHILCIRHYEQTPIYYHESFLEFA